MVDECLRRTVARRVAQLDTLQSALSAATFGTAASALEYARDHFSHQEATRIFWVVFFLTRMLPAEARQAALTMIETLAALAPSPVSDADLTTENSELSLAVSDARGDGPWGWWGIRGWSTGNKKALRLAQGFKFYGGHDRYRTCDLLNVSQAQ